MDFPFKSTKTFHQAFPVAYRQWKADSHCRLNHGYALTVHLEFGGFELDARNWLVDFGGLKQLKGQLEDWFDHAQLVAQDDPERELLLELGRRKIAKITEVERTGCEGLADFIFEHLNDGWLKINGYGGRIICTRVEVRETQSNMAMRCLSHADYERFCGGDPNTWLADYRTAGDTPELSLSWIEHSMGYTLYNNGIAILGIARREPGFEFSGKTYLTTKQATAAVTDYLSTHPAMLSTSGR